VISGRLADGTTPVTFACNLQTDTKFTEFNPDSAPGAGDHDWISIDSSGQYIVRAHQGGNDITVWDLNGTVIGNSRPQGHESHPGAPRLPCRLLGMAHASGRHAAGRVPSRRR
jgi:hypothetical protein